MTEGRDKFLEVGKKLKEESVQAEETAKEEKALILNDLKSIQANETLAKMYSDSASVGSDNLGGELPLLKVHSVGKSDSELADGSEPDNGAFFYKPTGEQFKEGIRCHILSISKSFRAEGLADSSGNKKMIFNQILSGVIIDGPELKLFSMYFTGLKLQPMWDIAKELGKYTKMKPMGIPMFAMTVKMTTEQVKNNFGKSWIVKFQLEKDGSGNPVLVGDPGEFQFLRDSVESMQGIIDSVIYAKTKGVSTPTPVKVVEEGMRLPLEDDGSVNATDIPF